MKKMCIATLFSLVSLTAFSQIKVIHFNAGWNKANDVEWFDKLSDVTKKTLSIDDEDIQKEYEIFIVPTIIVFDDS